ncbi:minor capsid protein [Solibacillus silvestris]
MAKRVPKTQFPTAATVSYERALRKMVRQVGMEALKQFDKHVAKELMQGDSPTFTNDGIFEGLKKMLGALKKKVSTVFTPNKTERTAKQFVNSVNRANRHNLEQQMKVKGIALVAAEPWVDDFMGRKIRENVGYIKNIEDEAYGRIEKVVREGVEKGSSAKIIRNSIIEQVEITEGRAQFLAVDQAGSILGQMTAERHKNIGIEKFTWDTSGDERVRDTHRALDGKVFAYDDPPTVGGRQVLPGEDYHCRCVGMPVFDDD